MKKNRWLLVVLGVVVLGIALLFSAAFGAGITYFFLKAEPVQAALAAPVDIENDAGVLISAVEEGGPADQAGLVRGDIILEINQETVNSLVELKDILTELQPGDVVALSVLHGDEFRSPEVKLDETKDFAYLGIDTCDTFLGSKVLPGGPMGDGFIKGFPTGAEIVEVVPESPAALAGLQVGDVIVSVDQKPVGLKGDLADLIQSNKPGDDVTLEIQSEGEEEIREVVVTLGENAENPEQAYLGVAYQSAKMPGFEGGMLPFMEELPFGELPEGFESEEGMPKFFFHHGEEFDGELPEGWQEGMPHFFGLPELPEGVEGAVIISEVMEDTPASEAGLQAGDLIISVDGEPVEEVDAFVNAMQSHKPGDEVTLTLIREDEQIDVQVTLSAHPDDSEKGFLGVMAGSLMIKGDMVLPEGFDQEFKFELPGVPGGDA